MAITFEIGFRSDGSSLASAIGPQLSTIEAEINKAFSAASSKGLTKEITSAVKEAQSLEAALKRATTDKGLSFMALNSELRKAGTSATQMVTTLASAGPQFVGSFNVALQALTTANRNVLSISNKIKEMQRVLTQSIKFTAAQEVQQAFMTAVSSAIGWVRELNQEITNIGVVTGKSGAELDKVYQTIVQGSQALRVAASDYAEASLIFYQQGLNDSEVARRTEITIQAARAANTSVQEMSSELTAIWNSYRMIGEEQQRAASVGAMLAAETAVDFKDIAQAMQTSASAASQMGVSYNSLAAIIATVGDTTQQSASVIGNAYKTIFSRFEQLKTEGTDGEITLNRVSAQLQSMGINVLDASGNLRSLDDVIMEVGLGWDHYSQKQQLAIAETVGGTRQYTQFLALMQNFGKYQDLLAKANSETGESLIDQFLSAQDSIEVAAENAREAWTRAFQSIFGANYQKEFYKIIEDIGNTVGGIIDGLGGLPGILMQIGTLLGGKIVPKLFEAGNAVKDLISNRSLKSQMESISKETDARREGTSAAFTDQRAAINASQISDKSKTKALRQIDFNQQAVEIKLNGSEQAQQAMVTINKMISEGNDLTRIRGENLKQQVEQYQAMANAGADDLVKAREQLDVESQNLNTLMQQLQVEQQKIDAQPDTVEEGPAAGDVEALQQAEAEADNYAAALDEVSTKLEALRQKQGSGGIILNQEYMSLVQEKTEYQDLLKATNERVNALQTTINTTRKVQNEEKAMEKSINRQAQAMTKFNKQINDMAKALAQAGKSSGSVTDALGEGVQDFKKEFGKTLSSLEIPDETKAKIGKSFSSMLKNGDVLAAVTDFKNSVSEAFADIGQDFDGSGLESVVAALEKIGVAENNLQGINNNLNGSATVVQMSFQNYAQAVANAGLGIVGFTSQAMNLWGAISSGNITVEGMITSLGMMAAQAKQMAGPIKDVVTQVLAHAAAQKILKQATDESTGTITAQSLAAQLGIKNVEGMTGADLKAAAAKKGVAISGLDENAVLEANTPIAATNAATWWSHPIIAIIAAACLAAVAAFMIINQVIENNSQKTAEAAEKSREQAAAVNEAATAVNESCEAYNTANEAMQNAEEGSEEYKQAQEDMATAAEDTIAKLDEMSSTLDAEGQAWVKAAQDKIQVALANAQLTGSYEELTAAMKEAQAQALVEDAKAAAQAVNGTGSQFIDEMRKGTGHMSGDLYKAKIGGGATSGDEKKAQELVEKGHYKHLTADGNDINIETNGTVEGMIEAYEEAIALQKEMESNMTSEQLAASENYQNLTDWLDKSKESYEGLIEVEGQQETALLNLMQVDPSNFADNYAEITGKTLDVSDADLAALNPESVTDMSSYEAYKENFLEIAEKAGIAKEAALDFFNSMPEMENFRTIDLGLDDVAEQTDMAKEELAAFYDGLSESEKAVFFSVDFDKAKSKEAMQAQIDELTKQAQYSKIMVEVDVDKFAEDFDMDADEIEDLADALLDMADNGDESLQSLKNNRKAAEEMAKEIKRFDKAVESCTDNYDDWNKALQSDSAEIQAEAVSEMKDAYGDLMDIDGSTLSSDFLKDAENLELMKQAINGSEEAYNSLVQNAMKDMLIQVGVDESQLEQLGPDIANVQAGLQDLEIGAAIQDAGLYESLNKIINAADMTAEEATQLLSDMGIEAEVEEEEVPKTQVATFIGAKPVVTTQDVTLPGPLQGEGSSTFKVPTVTYEKLPETAEATGHDTVTALRVKSARKGSNFGSGGGIKFNHSKAPTTTGGGGKGGGGKGGGGGGGGGSAKTKTASHKARTRLARKTRYEDLTKSADKIQDSTDKLNDTLDKAFGATRLAAYNKQQTALTNLAKTYDKLREAASSYYKVDKANLQNKIGNLASLGAQAGVSIGGITLEFDDETRDLLNPEVVRNAIVDVRNGLTSQENALAAREDAIYQAHWEDEDWKAEEGSAEYNELAAIEKEQKLLDERKEAVEDGLKDIEDLLDDLDEDHTQYQEALSAQLDAIHDWLQSKLDQAAYKLELKLTFTDNDIAILDNIVERFGEIGNYFGQSQRALREINGLIGQKAKDQMEYVDRLYEIRNNLDPNSPHREWFVSQFGQEAWDQFMDSRDTGIIDQLILDQFSSIQDIQSEWWDNQEAMWESFVSKIEQILAKWDTMIEDIDHQNAKIESWMSIMETAGTNTQLTWVNGIAKANQLYKDFMKADMDSTINKGKALRAQWEEQTAIVNKFQAQLNALGDASLMNDDDIGRGWQYDHIKEQLDEAISAQKQLEEEMLSTVEEVYSKASEYAEAWAEQIAAAWEANLGGIFSTMDSALEMYDQKDSLDKYYFDDYDKEYNLNKLRNQIDDYLEDNPNLDASALDRYRKLIDQINDAREDGVQINQTDLDILEQQFELEKAKDEYEQAKNAKNTMRLARDASGNWSYVYSNSGDDGSDALQKVDDALYNIRKLHKDAADEAANLWLQTQQKLEEYEQSIDWATYETDAKYREEVDTRRQWFLEQLQIYADEFVEHNDAIGRNQGDTTLGIVANIEKMEDTNKEYEEYHNQLVKSLQQNYDEWMGAANTARVSITGDTENLQESLEREYKNIQGDISDTDAAIKKLAKDNGEYLETALIDTTNWVTEMCKQYGELISIMDEYLERIGKIQGFDPNTDYSAKTATTLYSKGAQNWSQDEILNWLNNSDEGKALVSERNAKISANDEELGAYSMTNEQFAEWLYNYLHDPNSTVLAKEIGLDYLDNLDYSAKVRSLWDSHSASGGSWDTFIGNPIVQWLFEERKQKLSHMSKEEQERWMEGYALNNQAAFFKHWLGATSSGGLISTPQIRSLAEDGPELVLNRDDTKNILAAVSMMREVIAAQVMGINGTRISTGSVSGLAADLQPVQQEVKIEASFPGVSAASEIEQALNDLVNQAVLYAAKKQ